MVAFGANETFVPASELQEPVRRNKQLKGQLGRKTQENKIFMMQAVEKQFGSNGKPTKTIEWLKGNGSNYTAAESRNFAKDY